MLFLGSSFRFLLSGNDSRNLIFLRKIILQIFLVFVAFRLLLDYIFRDFSNKLLLFSFVNLHMAPGKGFLGLGLGLMLNMKQPISLQNEFWHLFFQRRPLLLTIFNLLALLLPLEGIQQLILLGTVVLREHYNTYSFKSEYKAPIGLQVSLSEGSLHDFLIYGAISFK